MKKQAFIFIGRSGSGKGTQAALLRTALLQADPSRGVRHIETGAEMRRFIQGPAATQRMAKGITESGGLQPEFIAIYQWTQILVNEYNAIDHLIFDGTPRKLCEAGALESIFSFYGIQKPWIIHLDVPHAEIHRRLLKRGRNDDTPEGISRRLDWYESDVAPTVAYYRKSPDYRFLNADGVGAIDSIHAAIFSKVLAD
ncbi:MAG TPA: nucleoside monophosphate kinase [Verrucomicrobiae bacterium]|jgi:adenylate kinase family enzyme|nr:nucleoside monophosphate kinase [Verrucomicrobiae bacterium]